LYGQYVPYMHSLRAFSFELNVFHVVHWS